MRSNKPIHIPKTEAAKPQRQSRSTPATPRPAADATLNPRTAPLAAGMAAAPPVRLALLGAGEFARDMHAPALQAQVSAGRAEVVAVWSRTRASAAALAAAYGARVAVCDGDSHPDPVDAARGRADAVVLALPIALLACTAESALRAGLHVLSEKPVAMSTDVADGVFRYVAAARPAMPVYAVAENLRFEKAVRRAAELVRERCGKVIGLHLVAQYPVKEDSKYVCDWRLQPAYNGGWLLDGGVHVIAAMRVLLGADVTAVCARASGKSEFLPPPDTVTASLEFASTGGEPIHGSMFLSYCTATFLWEMRVVGAKGDVMLARLQGKLEYRLSTYGPEKSDVEHVELPFTGIDEEFEQFVISCQTGKVHPDLDARAAYNDLATIEAMLQSASSGQLVTVKQLPR